MTVSAEHPRPKAGYHHGDLRRALIASAERLIASRGHARLSLREIAEAAGVSAAAPYRHFADREALIAAVLTDGFRELTRRTDAARRAAADPIASLGSVGMAYVQFAAERPSIYRLMFGAESNEAAHPELLAAGHAAYAVLADAVAACKAAGLLGDADTKTIALASWSLSHGLASLHAEGNDVAAARRARADRAGLDPHADRWRVAARLRAVGYCLRWQATPTCERTGRSSRRCCRAARAALSLRPAGGCRDRRTRRLPRLGRGERVGAAGLSGAGSHSLNPAG